MGGDVSKSSDTSKSSGVNKKALLEAALFVSDTPLTAERLAGIVGVSPEQIEAMLSQFKDELAAENHGIILEQTPEGFELRVKQEYRDKIASLAPFSDLSEGMLRTLAIVAAKQPIKQSVIVKYQGNKVYGYVVDLETKGLIKTEKFGRTKLITATPGFEKYFGKSTEEIKKMLSSKVEENDKVEEKEKETQNEKEDENES